MAKKEDENGYWLIEGNPISKGNVVLQYYGRDVSPELPPDELVNVFRPLSEISEKRAGNLRTFRFTCKAWFIAETHAYIPSEERKLRENGF